MERYTKKDSDGRYYIESVNGKLESNKFGHTYGEAIDRFAELENANVVEVVRCKECVYNEIGSCSNSEDCDPNFDPNFFCAHGERKEQTT